MSGKIARRLLETSETGARERLSVKSAREDVDTL